MADLCTQLLSLLEVIEFQLAGCIVKIAGNLKYLGLLLLHITERGVILNKPYSLCNKRKGCKLVHITSRQRYKLLEQITDIKLLYVPFHISLMLFHIYQP